MEKGKIIYVKNPAVVLYIELMKVGQFSLDFKAWQTLLFQQQRVTSKILIFPWGKLILQIFFLPWEKCLFTLVQIVNENFKDYFVNNQRWDNLDWFIDIWLTIWFTIYIFIWSTIADFFPLRLRKWDHLWFIDKNC